MKCLRSAMVVGPAGQAEPPAGTMIPSAPVPSEKRSIPNRPPGWSLAWSTTAPAPSPNRTQVLRSVQSMNRLNTSTPTSSTFRYMPLRMKLVAVARPKTKPEQAACMSNPAACRAPSSVATSTPVAGSG